jgi:hypothetical protein
MEAFQSTLKALYDDLVRSGPPVPEAVARAIAFEDEHELATPRVYASTAITSAGHKRNPDLPFGEVVAANGRTAGLLVSALRDYNAPHIVF